MQKKKDFVHNDKIWWLTGQGEHAGLINSVNRGIPVHDLDNWNMEYWIIIYCDVYYIILEMNLINL